MTTRTGPTVRSISDHPSPPTHQTSQTDTSKSLERPAVTDSSTSTEMPPDQPRHSIRHPQGDGAAIGREVWRVADLLGGCGPAARRDRGGEVHAVRGEVLRHADTTRTATQARLEARRFAGGSETLDPAVVRSGVR